MILCHHPFHIFHDVNIRRGPLAVWRKWFIQASTISSHPHPLDVRANHRSNHSDELGFEKLLCPYLGIPDPIFVEEFFCHTVQRKVHDPLPIPGFQNNLSTQNK